MCSNKPADFKLYTTSEAAAVLGVSLKTLRKWLDSGDIPHTRLGPAARLIRIRAEDIEAFLRAGAITTSQSTTANNAHAGL